MKKKTFIIVTASILMVSVIWLGVTPALFSAVASDAQRTAPHPGFNAPDFTLSTFEGENTSLSDYRGQVVLVFLWASWCNVCKTTMPGLQEVYQDYISNDFEILAVNMTFQDNLAEANRFFQTRNFTYPFLLDQDGSMARDYQLHALPTAVLVDRDGTVLDVMIGSGISSSFLRSQLNQLLSER